MGLGTNRGLQKVVGGGAEKNTRDKTTEHLKLRAGKDADVEIVKDGEWLLLPVTFSTRRIPERFWRWARESRILMKQKNEIINGSSSSLRRASRRCIISLRMNHNHRVLLHVLGLLRSSSTAVLCLITLMLFYVLPYY